MQKIMLARACAFLAIGAGVIFAANGAEWSSEYDEKNSRYTLTNSVNGASLYLTVAGELSVKTAGTLTELDLRSAALPSGLPGIVKVNSLQSLTKMETLYLPEAVETLADRFCYGLKSLKTVVFPNDCKLEKIPTEAFRESCLTRVEIPDSVKVIGGNAFLACTNMVYVALPANLEVLGNCAFQSCTALELVEPCIPGSVTNLGSQVFRSCGAMTNDVIIGEGYGADGKPRWVNIPYDSNWRNFSLRTCHKVKRLIFGPGVHNVPTMFYEGETFQGVEYIEFGVNVTNFSDNLNKCVNLTNVVFKRTDDFAFRDYQLGWGRASFHPFGTSLKELTFNGWFTFTLGVGNPFTYCSDLQLRMFVPGANLNWAAFMKDETKMTPWEKCSDKDKNTYAAKFTDGKVPVGISVAQTDGMKRFYIMSDGGTYAGNTIVMGREVASEFGTLTYSPAPAADGTYEEATDVTVTFTPANENVKFGGWVGDVGTADTNALSITVKVDGVLNLMPRFQASYLVYDAEAGTISDGAWMMRAEGAANEICISTMLNTWGLKVDVDLSKPILNNGRITKITGFGSGSPINSLKFPETVRWLSGMNNDGLSNQPMLSPLVPDAVTNLSASTFHKHWYQTGNFRIGFAKDDAGNVVETVMGSSSFDCTKKMGPKAEFGPGVKKIPTNFFSEGGTAFGIEYSGAMEIWFGENVASAAAESLRNFGNVNSTKAKNPVSVHFAGDMFDGTSGMFLGGTTSYPKDYMMRFYVGADGCDRWQGFVQDEKYVTPWSKLDEAAKQAYWDVFPKGEEFGTKRPYGLTTEAAVMTNKTVDGVAYGIAKLTSGMGLPKNQWVFSLKTPGFMIFVR